MKRSPETLDVLARGLDSGIATLAESRPLLPAVPVTRRFVNPICEGADPWVMRHGPHYYYCQTEGHDGIAVLKSDRLSDKGVKRVVWRPQRGQWNSRDIWAPELHHIDGRWYIYYTASNGRNENHRAGVLRARTDDPQGPYEDLGVLYTGDHIATGRRNRWAIDATPLQLNGRLYLVWSGWENHRDVQFLYIAPMENPWTVGGNRVKLCHNATYRWERVADSPRGRGLNEGPQILQRHGRVFIIYSCSSSWDPTYKLGMLYMDETANPLDPASWTKASRPVFEATETVFGVGHASFTTSPDGTQDWIVFHAKQFRKPGWERAVYIQPFTWTADGFPDFGRPGEPTVPILVPSGEPGNVAGELFVDAFTDESWDDWVYYGHTRYIWIDDSHLNLGGPPGEGAVNCYRTGEKALVRGRDYTDFNLHARIRVEAGDREAGLLFRVQEPALGYHAQKGYFAGYSVADERVVLGYTDNATWHPMAEAPCRIEPGAWFTLRVQTRGAHIRVYVNNTLAFSTDDATYATGMVGVRVVDSHAEFDDFEVVPE